MRKNWNFTATTLYLYSFIQKRVFVVFSIFGSQEQIRKLQSTIINSLIILFRKLSKYKNTLENEKYSYRYIFISLVIQNFFITVYDCILLYENRFRPTHRGRDSALGAKTPFSISPDEIFLNSVTLT